MCVMVVNGTMIPIRGSSVFGVIFYASIWLKRRLAVSILCPFGGFEGYKALDGPNKGLDDKWIAQGEAICVLLCCLAMGFNECRNER